MSARPTDGPPGAEQGRLGPPEGARRPRHRPARRGSLAGRRRAGPGRAPVRRGPRRHGPGGPRGAGRRRGPGAADRGADRAGAGRAGPGRRRPPGPRQALPGRRLGGGQGPLQGAAARPVAPRPLPGRGPAGAPPPEGEYPRSRPACSTPPPPGAPSSTTPSAWRTASPTCPGCSAGPRTATGAGRYLASPAELRDAARRRLAATLGPAAGSILDVVEAGAARDALGLAVACEVVFAEGADEPALLAAAARLERFHRNRPIPPDVGRLLARAGRDAIDDLDGDEPEQAQGHLLRADALLREVQAAPFAHLGRLTPLAWEGRLRRFARALAAATDPADAAALAAAEDAALRVADHAIARQRAHREPVRARRGWPCGWPAGSAPPRRTAGSFAQLAGRYRDEVACGGPGARRAGRGRRPGRAVRRLRPPGARRRRRAGPRSTGRSASPWPTGPAAARTPARCSASRTSLARAVANVLDAKVPVLLVVLDGMSWPVAHELLADLRRLHWVEASLPASARAAAPGHRRDPQRHRVLAHEPAGRDG